MPLPIIAANASTQLPANILIPLPDLPVSYCTFSVTVWLCTSVPLVALTVSV
jgi:hypothetical protein